MEFKDRIKQLREEKGLDLTKLAVQFDMKEAGVRAWESGRTKPGADTLIKLAEYFNCTTDYLLGVSDVRTYDESEKDKEILKLRWKNIDYGLLIERIENCIDEWRKGV